MPSVVCRSSQGSCLGQLPCRHWSVLPVLGSPGSSSRVFYRPVPTPSRPRGPSSSRTQPPVYSGGLRRSQRPTHPPPGGFCAPDRRPSRRPRASEPYRRPPGGSGGRGVRPRDSRGRSSAAFPAAARLLGCLYFRPLGGFHLNPGVRTAVLAKDAIEPVDPLLSPGCSTRRTFS